MDIPLSRIQKARRASAGLLVALLLTGTPSAHGAEWQDLRTTARDGEAQASGENETKRVIVLFESPDEARQRIERLTQEIQLGQGQWINFNDEVARLEQEGLRSLGWTNLNDLVRFESVPAVALSANPQQMQDLMHAQAVKGVFEDQTLHLINAPTNTAQIGAAPAWNLGATGEGQIVAIVDTGVDAGHEFLRDKVVAEACFSSTGQKGDGTSLISLCPNGQSIMEGKGSARPCDHADCRHGTHVAGIAAGHTIGNRSGVAPNARIVAVNVFHKEVAPDGQARIVSQDSDIMQAMEWILKYSLNKHPVSAINLSLGGRAFDQHCDMLIPYHTNMMLITEAAKIFIVAASGNGSKKKAIATPSCASNVISVGAVDSTDQVAEFSNSANILTLLAPGVQIHSSIPGGSYLPLDGTSMAAPHVAGALAALRSLAPKAKPSQLLETLVKTGTSIKDPRNRIATPRINLAKASAPLLQGNTRADAPPPSRTAPPVAKPVTPTPPPPSQNTDMGGINVYDNPRGSGTPDGRQERIQW